jgi:hypothetical protein
MIVWRWIRGLRWWWQALIAVIGMPLALALVYVGGRSMQYLVAEGDAGLYAPASVHVLARAKGLEGHLDRIEKTFAWNTIERKLLRDPAIRPRLNAELRQSGLPTLDDLADPRKGGQLSRSNLSRFAGRDLVVGLAAPDSWKTARFCAATRLGWLEYLGTPFAPLALKRDGDLLRAGPLWIGFEGAIAVAGNDKALVQEALRGRGKAPEGSRPMEVVVRFDGSRPLKELRSTVAGLGLLPHLKLETSKTVRVSADLDGTAARIDAVLEGVETAYPGQPPPHALLALAPASTTGLYATPASLRDIYEWVRAGASGMPTSNVRQAIDTLEKAGMSDRLLPLIDPGIALITGQQENEGKVYPCFALMVRTSDPAKASDALKDLVLKIGGNMGKGRFDEDPVGDTLLRRVEWPKAVVGINDFFQPCWAGVQGGLLFANNRGFAEAVLAAGTGGDLWRDRRMAKKLRSRLKEVGFAENPGMAGGLALPPLLRESLDGPIQWFSRVAALPNGDAALATELDREWAEQGRSGMSAEEKHRLFQAAREAKIQEYEAELRRSLRGLDPVRWCAFESAEVSGGISLRLAIGFDSLTDR